MIILLEKFLLPSINKLPLASSFNAAADPPLRYSMFTLEAIHAQIEIQNYWFTAVNYRHVSCINIILQKEEEENYERGKEKIHKPLKYVKLAPFLPTHSTA